MGFFDFLSRARIDTNQALAPYVNGAPFQAIDRSVSGTKSYSGYIEEEYLTELQGYKGAEVFDRIRKSDAIIKMVLRAVKLPIRSAQWTIDVTDDSQEAISQQALLKHILFEDMGKTWTQFTGEALTMIEHGYSLFEISHKPVLNNEEFGPYIGIKRLGFRKQATIQRWQASKDGVLESVEQQVDGDYAGIYTMDPKFLLRFCPDQEGDNFEGESYLRACYGPWFRKSLYQKLLAAAIEKTAIPVPIATIPAGKENSSEVIALKNILAKFTSNQINYIIKPEGWLIEMTVTNTQVEKIGEQIKNENHEMVNSVLGGFLLLGQSGSGSFALGSTLGDFFGTSVQFLGDHLCEVINTQLLPGLVKLNFGKDKLRVKLKVEGIKDSASASFADVIQKLIQSRAITTDSDLEKFIREKFKLPMAMPRPLVDTLEPLPDTIKPANMQFSENPNKVNQSKLIRSGAGELREMMKTGLRYIALRYIEKMKREYRGASAIERMKIPNTLSLEVPNDFRTILSGISMVQAWKATLPSKSKKQLASIDERLQKIAIIRDEYLAAMSEYSVSKDTSLAVKIAQLQRALSQKLASVQSDMDLTAKTKASVKSRVETLSDTQAGDLKKRLDLQYNSSLSSTDSEMTLFSDINTSMNDFLSSPVITTGPDVLASQNVNDSILTETEDDPEVESYTFIAVDDDVTTDICRELNGRTFAKDDPDLNRYHAPLHFNCRSYMAVNLKSFKGNPGITMEELNLSKAAQDGIVLSEHFQEKRLV